MRSHPSFCTSSSWRLDNLSPTSPSHAQAVQAQRPQTVRDKWFSNRWKILSCFLHQHISACFLLDERYNAVILSVEMPYLRLLSYPKDHRHISRGHPLRRDFSAHSGLQANILHFRFLRYVWIKLPCDLSNLLQGLHMLQVFYLSVFSYRKMYSINKYNGINLVKRTFLPVLYLRKEAVCDIGYHTPRAAFR